MFDDHAVGMDKGTDDDLMKPFTLKELLDRMRALSPRQNTKITHHAI
jgi:DNA-binding response OmpR family regulator